MNDRYLSSLLSDREEILLVTRQHWFVLVRSVILELILAGLIIAGTLISLAYTGNGNSLLGLILLIIPIGSVIIDYLKWQNRKYIVTNRRVIQIDGIYNKNVTDSSLEKVNDVKMVQSMWGRIFDFADIEILTASELGANLFRIIGDPIRFKTAMVNAKEKLEGYDNHTDDNIPHMIAELDDLRQKGIISDIEFQRKKAELLAKL
jgi:uncharacterized membrane protein YdbT with pleckstrin-like domain